MDLQSLRMVIASNQGEHSLAFRLLGHFTNCILGLALVFMFVFSVW